MQSNRRRGETCLLVFAKYPRAGEVKTRLTPPLSYQEGAELYKAFLCDSLDVYQRQSDLFKSILYVAENRDIEKMSDLLSEENVASLSELRIQSQQGITLGERLSHAFTMGFDEGFQRVCVIGTDHPTLPVEFVREGFDALNDQDVVLGPADDGGYYIIGMSSSYLFLLQNMPWSQETLYEQTVQKAKGAGLSLHVLPKWYDVDDEGSLRKLMSEADIQSVAPRTANVIRQLALITSGGQSES